MEDAVIINTEDARHTNANPARLVRSSFGPEKFTHSPPSMNIPNMDNFREVFICKRQMTVHGKVRVIMSRTSSLHTSPRYRDSSLIVCPG